MGMLKTNETMQIKNKCKIGGKESILRDFKVEATLKYLREVKYEN